MPHTLPEPCRHPASAGLRWLKQACLLLYDRQLLPFLLGLTLLQIIGTAAYFELTQGTPWQAWGRNHPWSWDILHILVDLQIGQLLLCFFFLLVRQRQETGQTDWRTVLPPLRRRYPALVAVSLILFALFFVILPTGISVFLYEVRSLSPYSQAIAFYLIISLLSPVQTVVLFLLSPLMLVSVPAKQALHASWRAARLNWLPLLIVSAPFWLGTLFFTWVGSGLFDFDPGLYDRLYYAWLPLIISPIEPFLFYLPYRDIYGTTPPKVFR